DLAARLKIYRFHYVSNRYAASELARALRNAIDAQTTRTPAFDKQLILVAHSLGGLVARSYMNEYSHLTGQYAGRRGGERVARLITLATPHHGNPAAGEQSWQAISTNVEWTALLNRVLGIFWGAVRANQPSRADLLWDNIDLRLPAGSAEINQWLANLN